MAMSRFTMIFVCFVLRTIGQAQELQMTLSIDWDKAPVYLRYTDTTQQTNTPFLLITYQNLTGSDIYFKKLNGDRGFLPVRAKEGVFTVLHQIAAMKDGYETLRITTKPSTRRYDVDLQVPSAFYSDDFIYDLKIHSTNKYNDSTDRMEVGIELLNDILAKQAYLNDRNTGKQLVFFDYPGKKTVPYSKLPTDLDLIVDSRKNIKAFVSEDSSKFPLEHYKPAFCFLKNKEIYTEKINLLPLLVIGGTYHFTLTNQEFQSHVSVFLKNLNPRDAKEMELPKRVGSYNLFLGRPNTNEVSITFDKKMDPGYSVIGKK